LTLLLLFFGLDNLLVEVLVEEGPFALARPGLLDVLCGLLQGQGLRGQETER